MQDDSGQGEPRAFREGVLRYARSSREGRRVFPSRKSPITLVSAAFSEMDEDWASRRWFSDESMGRVVEGAKVNVPAPAYGGSAAFAETDPNWCAPGTTALSSYWRLRTATQPTRSRKRHPSRSRTWASP